MMAGTERDPNRRWREAPAEELGRLLASLRDELGVEEARQILLNPFVTGEILEALADVPRLTARYELRRELAAHPRAPRTLALRFVAGLYWRDLAEVASRTRVHPIVRRAAERRLLERLPGLAIGERVALARRASAGLISALRLDSNPRVIAALLENPRMTEASLLPLAVHERASAACLAVVAASGRWASRPAVRAALCRNPATPAASALRLLPGLGRDQLAAVAADGRLAAAVRNFARERLTATSVGAGLRR